MISPTNEQALENCIETALVEGAGSMSGWQKLRESDGEHRYGKT